MIEGIKGENGGTMRWTDNRDMDRERAGHLLHLSLHPFPSFKGADVPCWYNTSGHKGDQGDAGKHIWTRSKMDISIMNIINTFLNRFVSSHMLYLYAPTTIWQMKPSLNQLLPMAGADFTMSSTHPFYVYFFLFFSISFAGRVIVLTDASRCAYKYIIKFFSRVINILFFLHHFISS